MKDLKHQTQWFPEPVRARARERFRDGTRSGCRSICDDAEVAPDTEFIRNPVTIRTTDGRNYSARVDIPRGDPALPMTDDELLSKYRDSARSQLRPDDMERSVGLVLGLDKVADIGRLMATLNSPLRKE